MLLEINSVAQGGLETIFEGGKKIKQIRKFSLSHSQVLLEINSVAQGGLGTIFEGGKKIKQIRKFCCRPLTGAPGK